MVRLLKPLEYYHQKYGTWTYGLNKLYLLMEKQHNRGQEGAGLACVKLEASPGEEYMFRERALGTGAITEIFAAVHHHYKGLPPERLDDPLFAKANLPFAGELYMGHLRYSTTGKSGISYVHPFLRRNNWRAKNLALCGNFNLTNVQEIFEEITAIGQHPRAYADTFIMLEQVGHALDREVERLYQQYKAEGLQGMEITHAIEAHVDLSNVLKRCAPQWDGGFVICGLTGSGEAFSVRDPWGIRPAFYYADDEIVILASERPVIQTTMHLDIDQVKELAPGSAIIVNQKGDVTITDILGEGENQRCSFERIYFSRGSDADIYKERKALGREIAPAILKAVDNDLENTVLSFIPNTAEVAYIGLMEGMEHFLKEQVAEKILNLDTTSPDYKEQLCSLLDAKHLRCEKIAIKDIKLRTFITEGDTRDDLAAHVYDVTYGQVKRDIDNLVVIDDSIVRGTTLKQSIIGILDRLHPRRIIIVSSSPQVRYPDYYGIDMSRMSEFAAFRAAIRLLKKRGMQSVIDDVYAKCKAQQGLPKEQVVNYVNEIYAPFTDEEVSDEIAEMLTPAGTKAEVKIIYQTLDGLHKSIPGHPGDWYFSGNYPTPGGNRMVNLAFINYYEGNPNRRN